MTVTTTRPGRDPVERTEQRIANGAAGTWTGTIDAPDDASPRRLVTDEREPALIGDAVPVAGTEFVYTDVVELSD